MNLVELSGYLKENLDAIYRELEFAIPGNNIDHGFSTKIVCKYWTNSPNSLLINYKSEHMVGIRGHLERDQKFGIILVVEEIEEYK